MLRSLIFQILSRFEVGHLLNSANIQPHPQLCIYHEEGWLRAQENKRAPCLPLGSSAPLLTCSPEERPRYYLFNTPTFSSSILSFMHPASQAMNTLWGLRAVGWTTCAVFTWLSRERVRKTGTLKPNRCMIQRRELWRVNFLYKSMLVLEQTAAWSCPRKHLCCMEFQIHIV